MELLGERNQAQAAQKSPCLVKGRGAYRPEEGESALGHKTRGRASRKKQARSWTLKVFDDR